MTKKQVDVREQALPDVALVARANDVTPLPLETHPADGHDANGKRERRRIKPEFDWRHSGAGWDNGGLIGSEGALGSHCTWR